MSTLLVGIMLLAQAGAGTPETPPIQLHGFIDAFYALNTNRPFDGASFLQGTGTTARSRRWLMSMGTIWSSDMRSVI